MYTSPASLPRQSAANGPRFDFEGRTSNLPTQPAGIEPRPVYGPIWPARRGTRPVGGSNRRPGAEPGPSVATAGSPSRCVVCVCVSTCFFLATTELSVKSSRTRLKTKI